tara:strand:- start:5628 stop:6821 length:1194 start_codon:yes stop_codon:yes gene_type:complete
MRQVYSLIEEHLKVAKTFPNTAQFARYLHGIDGSVKYPTWKKRVERYQIEFGGIEYAEHNPYEDLPAEWEGTWRSLAIDLHAKSPEITLRAWEGRIHEAKTRGLIKKKQRPNFITTTFGGEPTHISDVWNAIEVATGDNIKKAENARWAEISFGGKKHIAIALASDQHIGNKFTDHERMREDAELVANTPNCYAIHAGDFIDNFIIDKPRPSMKATIPPNVQWKLCDHYLSMFEDKILAVVAGNHDLWTSGMTDYDPLSRQVLDRNILYHPHELNIRLMVGNVPYNFSIRHKRRGNSSLNPARVVKKMWEDGEHDFDIGVVGHHHTPVVENFTRHGIERWAVRPGSYKIIDGFAEMIGFQKERPTCPVVILSPQTRHIQVFSDLRDGLETLRVLNGE